MLIMRLFKKNRTTKHASVIHLILCVLFVCFCIYVWVSSGCVGFSDCYLCKTFTPKYIFDKSLMEKSTTNDFTRLMNLENFTFLMNHLVCNDSDVLLLVLVHSNPNNYEKRSIIRNTWGVNVGNEFKVMFLLGIPNSTDTQRRLENENSAHGDLLQGNFLDSYRNLTYKHVMAFKWTKYFCPKIKYLLKADDDIFVNSPSFLHYVSGNLPKENLMQCLPIYNARPKRTSRSKWKVTFSEYEFRLYPPYCQGFAILYSRDVVLELYSKAQLANYFWIDDVFITGFLAMSANYTPSSFGKFILEPHIFQLLMKKGSEVFSYLLGPWNMSVVDILKLWEIASKAGYIKEVINT